MYIYEGVQQMVHHFCMNHFTEYQNLTKSNARRVFTGVYAVCVRSTNTVYYYISLYIAMLFVCNVP